MKAVWLTCAMFVLAQSGGVTREAKSDGTVFYAAPTTATDESAATRRIQFVIRSDKDRFDAPETDALIRLEVKQATRGEYFDARAEARCDGKVLFASTRLHSYTEMDAETVGVFTRFTISETESLAACAKLRLSLAGIEVRLTEAQVQPLKAAMFAAKNKKGAD